MSRLHHLLFAALCLAPSLTLAQVPADSRLKKVQDSHAITLAYRTDALPFSYENADKKPEGYTIDLCKAVVAGIEQQLGTGPLNVKWVPVTTQNRFTTLASGQADMECGASTVTLARKKEVGFSSLIFLDGTGLLVMKATPGYSLMALNGKKIGVITGTSNERALADALKGMSVSATVVPVKTREEGLQGLESGAFDAFASDRLLLLGLLAKAKDPTNMALLSEALSYEPYAIALPRGDWALQQAVDAALAQVYSSPALQEIYTRWFGGLGDPSPAMMVMFGLGRLPE
ncbi:amino acid ABC transporter substrate-binding protein [Ramlibacter sp. G-1-2-2]|uniref:Amino acid ABC transporter substrate-binding protein n=1 Tax=Ramlibacter agri TaxID=2728837 RepID=A0A848GWL0_9BURK|nr:amino acid ABC transporter substrate-binding protein [Ramlibacter agri]NML42517.1 amino acid ABC transporter substrate-binding protein [Ramlibacter agri]